MSSAPIGTAPGSPGASRRLRHTAPQRSLTATAVGAPVPARRELGGYVSLAGVQVFQLLAGLITAPLLAHALGAEGRGLLATVAVPLGVSSGSGSSP